MIPQPGAHGGDGHRLATALGVHPDAVLDLSVSLNPFAPPVAPLIAEHAGAVRAYPDPAKATAAVADALGVAIDRVLLTNGGAEAIALVAAERPVGWVDDPDFSLYRRSLRTISREGPRWRSNPHNPTGQLARATDSAAIWDEAFYPLATGQWTRGDNAIVVGSLTKLFACPGLRVGYVLAPDAATIDSLRASQPQWSVSALACAIIPTMLTQSDLPAWATAIRNARLDLTALLEEHDLEAEPSDANYVLVRAAPGLRTHLATHAVLVRDTASFGLTDGVRIAVPDADGIDRLHNAMKGYR